MQAIEQHKLIAAASHCALRLGLSGATQQSRAPWQFPVQLQAASCRPRLTVAWLLTIQGISIYCPIQASPGALALHHASLSSLYALIHMQTG